MSNATLDAATLDKLRTFVEDEAALLDERRYDEWQELYAEDGVYWAPSKPDQQDWTHTVSLYFDDKHTIKTRIERLKHSMIHCQEPASACVRVLSSLRVVSHTPDSGEYKVRSKFIMLEDRRNAERRTFGGNYIHTLRVQGDSFAIVQKRVELTNCDASFPMLTQPF